MTRRIRNGLLMGVAVFLLTACSKTVKWEEEVPLNTGEVIWVKRTVTYKLQGSPGNPFDIDYLPDWTETLEFTWRGKTYSYTGDADIMLLAISPKTQQPVLVAEADNKSWNWKHNYRCTTPFYVQFVPAPDGREWTWPPAIEPWLYELPYNIMGNIPSLQDVKTKYSSDMRLERDSLVRYQSPSSVQVKADYLPDECRK